MDKTSALEEILEKYCKGKTVNDIERIYHGLDHHCRCGCGGSYFEFGERGFTRAINKLHKGPFVYDPSEIEYYEDGFSTFVNIPEVGTDDKCYCIYFKK